VPTISLGIKHRVASHFAVGPVSDAEIGAKSARSREMSSARSNAS